ncbi:MAG: type II toxin-antitoxin system VapC family toxin [Chloroflexi bacterium]|nr:type II toxin-antitoxin system VapC family toxin [Chloroflexota bacterium]
MTAADFESAVRDFDALSIQLVDSAEWVDRALVIARRFDQSNIFDAMYLACAEDLDAELWTCDRRFAASFGPSRPQRLLLCPADSPAGA